VDFLAPAREFRFIQKGSYECQSRGDRQNLFR
jgi:hypothetical protein